MLLCHLCSKWPEITSGVDGNSLMPLSPRESLGLQIPGSASARNTAQVKQISVIFISSLWFLIQCHNLSLIHPPPTQEGMMSFPVGCKLHGGTQMYKRQVPKHSVSVQLVDLNSKCHAKNITSLPHRRCQLPAQQNGEDHVGTSDKPSRGAGDHPRRT